MRRFLIGLSVAVSLVGCEQQVSLQSTQDANEPSTVEVTPAGSFESNPAQTVNAPATPAASPAANDTQSISVDFVRLQANARGEFVVLRFTNQTEQTIAQIMGAVHVYDQDGNIVRAYGYTDQLFNYPPQHSSDLPLLKLHPDRPMAAHRDTLDQLRYEFVAKQIVFADAESP